MARVASGQITIVDLNDGKAVQAYTSASRGETQIYNPDTKVYNPAWTSSEPQVVTAHVYVTGESTDQAPLSICKEWAWKVNGTAVTASGDISFSKNVLTIKKNIDASNNFMNIEWSCEYHDVDTGAVTQVRGYKTLTLASSGGATGVVLLDLPNGDTFDESNSKLQTLTIEARLWRGSTQDTTIKSATWEKLNLSTGQWDVLGNEVVTALSGGMSKLTVKADDVQNFQSYRCKMTDTETSEVFTAFATLKDMTDPYAVVLVGGEKIVNGAGSVKIAARVFRNGTLVEDENTAPANRKFTYTWTKIDPATGLTVNWDGTSSATKTGNPMEVTAADVNVRVTLYCEVSK